MFPAAVAPGFHGTILAACQAAGFTPEVGEQAAEWHTIVGLVGAGLGVAIVPAALQRLAWPSVAFRRLVGCAASARLVIARRPGDGSPAAAAFVRLARATARDRQA
jgi:DNA-binding transcriptional LysR family regulator